MRREALAQVKDVGTTLAVDHWEKGVGVGSACADEARGMIRRDEGACTARTAAESAEYAENENGRDGSGMGHDYQVP